ncbi:MAG: (d)CMP kinase [Clostridia bacterium]|nr:(d)CMP kinase [Clostridia bacterium]
MISVAIDGPAGAGKSSIAKLAAAELGYIYIDTGALYRSIGLFCINQSVDIHDKNAVVSALDKMEINIIFKDQEQRVILNDKDVSDEIRTEEVSRTASVVSAIPEVRAFLLSLQRSFAEKNNVIMDGRDIGTVVLPEAQVKIFLTASPEERAARRTKQLEEKGITADYNQILKDIIERDYNDSHRETAPLKPASDSVTVDTTNLSFEQSVARITELIKESAE